MIFGAILLHLGIALNMGLVVFSLFMFTLLLAWMPPDAIRRVFARPPVRLPKLEVRFTGGPAAADGRGRGYAADVWHQADLEDRAQPARSRSKWWPAARSRPAWPPLPPGPRPGADATGRLDSLSAAAPAGPVALGGKPVRRP